MRHTCYAASSAVGRSAAVVVKHSVEYGQRGALRSDCTTEVLQDRVVDEPTPLQQQRRQILREREIDKLQGNPFQTTKFVV